MTEAGNPKPVVYVSQAPQFVSQADGTVRASYPGEDWFVVGAGRQDATSKLIAESRRRIQDPEYVAAHFELAQKHLRGETVTPGFDVTTISKEDYQMRTEALGDRLEIQVEEPLSDD
jgi:hypothetical protein